MAAKQKRGDASETDFLERIPDNLLLEPIEYMFADHCRQAEMCRVLERLAAGSFVALPSPEAAAAILQCLTDDVALHIEDEEVDLFPRLRVRAAPTDHVADILALMDREHHRDQLLADEVGEALACIAKGEPPENLDAFRSAAERLAEMHTSHLNWENVVVLPLARKCLTKDDHDAMARTMAARRGIPLPRPGE